MAVVFEKLDSQIIVSLFRKLHHLFGTDYRFELYHGAGGGIKMQRYSKSESKLLQFNLPIWPDTNMDTLFNWDIQRDYCPIGEHALMRLVFDVQWTVFEQQTVKNCLLECGGKIPIYKRKVAAIRSLDELQLRLLANLHKKPTFVDEKTHDILYDCRTHDIIIRMMFDQKTHMLQLGQVTRPTYLILFNVGGFLSGGRAIARAANMLSLLIRTNILNCRIEACMQKPPYLQLAIVKLFYDNFSV